MLKRLLQLAIALSVIGSAQRLILGGAIWNGQPYNLTIPTHISAVGQAPTGSINLSLQHDSSCTIGVSVAQTGNEVLTYDGHILTTSYMLTGTALHADADADWVNSTAFLTHVYHIPTSGTDTLTLSVKAAPPANTAPPAGDYTASIILTVTW